MLRRCCYAPRRLDDNNIDVTTTHRKIKLFEGNYFWNKIFINKPGFLFFFLLPGIFLSMNNSSSGSAWMLFCSRRGIASCKYQQLKNDDNSTITRSGKWTDGQPPPRRRLMTVGRSLRNYLSLKTSPAWMRNEDNRIQSYFSVGEWPRCQATTAWHFYGPILAAAVAAQLVKHPELRSLKELQLNWR